MRSSLVVLAVTLLFTGCKPSVDSPAAHDSRNPIAHDVESSPELTADVTNGSKTAAVETPKGVDTRGAETASLPDGRISPPISPPQELSNEVEIITFDDLNIGMPVDSKFRPIMLQYNDGRVKSLFGKRINVAGYMNATDTLTGVKEFILLRNLECKFGPGGQADHLVHVLLQGDVETEYTDKVVHVEGVLELSEFPPDGPATWSIYDLKATKVSTRPPPRRR